MLADSILLSYTQAFTGFVKQTNLFNFLFSNSKKGVYNYSMERGRSLVKQEAMRYKTNKVEVLVLQTKKRKAKNFAYFSYFLVCYFDKLS